MLFKSKRSVKAAAVCAAVSVMLCGCGSEDGFTYKPEEIGNTANSQTSNSPLWAFSNSSGSVSEPRTDGANKPDNLRGTDYYLDGDQLEILRLDKESPKDLNSDGVWTVFVYMCATDLESESACATDDLQEMIDATSKCGKLRFVIEADGVKEWQNDILKSNYKNRMVIEKGQYNIVDTLSSTNMGAPETLEAFIKWAVPTYSSEHMILDFWDHGGGSVNGVCFDEDYNCDSLGIDEIDRAFAAVYDTLPQKFDIIGFDACLMATVETANILVPYADYMAGSQEVEPGNGWDYNTFASGVNAGVKNGAEMGSYLLDGYYNSCRQTGEEDTATFSIIDLSKINDFIIEFNEYSKEAYNYAVSGHLSEVIAAAKSSPNFGSNNSTEGYTNMVDVGGLLKNSRSFAAYSSSKAYNALNVCIAEMKNGALKQTSSGISVYYPLCVQGSTELSDFTRIAPSPYYLALVDLCAYGYSSMGDTANYDSGALISGFDGLWDGNDTLDQNDYNYWEEDDGGSYSFDDSRTALEFEIAPHINENGYYYFKLTNDSLPYLDNVYCNVMESVIDEDTGKELMLDLGTDFSVDLTWETGECQDDFDGYWFVLPDGQSICVYLTDYIWDEYERCVLYTSPVYLNGEYTNLKIKQSFPMTGDGSFKTEIIGAYDGIGENGEASKYIYQIQPGDVIVPLFFAYDAETYEYVCDYVGQEYKCNGTHDIDMDYMYDADYYYAFEINDYFGNTLYTDFVLFNIENGEVYYYE